MTTMQLRPSFSLLLLSVSLLLLSCGSANKDIRSVADIRVDAPEGTAPVLPYQVWVTYSDRSGEWRQVKWTNSLRETEEEEAALPAGETYTVQGYILGDNTTENGYPVEAHVTVVAGTPAPPAPQPGAPPPPRARRAGAGAGRPAAAARERPAHRRQPAHRQPRPGRAEPSLAGYHPTVV